MQRSSDLQQQQQQQIRSSECKRVAKERATAASKQQCRLEDQACTAENILTGNATNVLYLPSVDKSGT